MTTTEVLAGPVGEGGSNDGKDAKLVRRLPDDGRAREAGEPGDPAWEALAAYHLAGVRSGRVCPEDLAFVPLPQAGDPSFSEADMREAFAVYLMFLRERI